MTRNHPRYFQPSISFSSCAALDKNTSNSYTKSIFNHRAPTANPNRKKRLQTAYPPLNFPKFTSCEQPTSTSSPFPSPNLRNTPFSLFQQPFFPGLNTTHRIHNWPYLRVTYVVIISLYLYTPSCMLGIASNSRRTSCCSRYCTT